jgi:EAL domain-containing protein (putative c-di-GMP-specific phosphodiesterase class I)
VLQRAELDPGSVVIEITEREEIERPDKARQSIASLKAMGIAVAIDDAGTGHNGLASVQRLGAAMLKIDKLFVDGIEQDPRAGRWCRCWSMWPMNSA